MEQCSNRSASVIIQQVFKILSTFYFPRMKCTRNVKSDEVSIVWLVFFFDLMEVLKTISIFHYFTRKKVFNDGKISFQNQLLMRLVLTLVACNKIGKVTFQLITVMAPILLLWLSSKDCSSPLSELNFTKLFSSRKRVYC